MTWLALAAAVGAHLLFGVLWSWQRDQPEPAAGLAAGALPRTLPGDPPADLAAVALLDAPTDPVRPAAGAEDRAPVGAGHPLPAADVDSPGERAAARAGGGTGGPEAASDQHYRRAASEQPWSDPEITRQQRLRTGARAASDEAILRDPDRGIDQQTSPARRQATGGAEHGRAGLASGSGAAIEGDPGVDWSRMDPRYPQGAGARVAQRSAGASDPEPRHGFVERGAPSADALRDGAPGDTRTVAGASAELDPLPADLITPRSGRGDGDGIRGRERLGHAARGRGRGSAATTAEIASGGGTAMWARKDDPYFRRLHERLEREVRFPHALAIRLEQGDLVVRIELRADGSIDRIQVTKPSDFSEFDRELVRALRAVSPLGPVPRALLGRGGHLLVLLEYEFRNRVIR